MRSAIKLERSHGHHYESSKVRKLPYILVGNKQWALFPDEFNYGIESSRIEHYVGDIMRQQPHSYGDIRSRQSEHDDRRSKYEPLG